MFFHSTCKHEIIIPADDNIKLGVDGISIDSRNKVMRVSSLIVVQTKTAKKIKPVFYCMGCEEIITEPKEIQIHCSYCGHSSNPENHYVLQHGGGNVCKTCMKKLMTRTDDPVPEKEFVNIMEILNNGIEPMSRNSND
jgi:hypothetical protein